MPRLNRAATCIAAATLFLAAPASVAQSADPAALAVQREAIARLSWMDGAWRGPAVTQRPGGEHRIVQTERIGNLLGGTIKLLEGRGYEADGSTGFNAFGVISYDPQRREYDFRSYAQGRSGTFRIVPGDKGYVWEIPAGPATIRYTATLANGEWTEVGDRIVPGQPAQRFFEMHLRRIGDSNWPAGQALTSK